MSKVKNRFKKILLEFSAILVLALLVGGLILFFQIDAILGRNANAIDEPPRTPEEERIISELPDSIRYTLRRRPTEYQLELFEILVYTHGQFYEVQSDTNLRNYASAIARNFVADFFTLSNKTSRTDVGGLQFFSENVVDDFRSDAIDYFYLYLNQHIEVFGNESLPTVVSTTVLDVDFGTQFIEADELEPIFDMWGERIPQGEDIRTIVVDIEWTYAFTTLPNIDEFQTVARIILIETEDGIRIYAIELIVEDTENQYHLTW